jgi:hypothetical protein
MTAQIKAFGGHDFTLTSNGDFYVLEDALAVLQVSVEIARTLAGEIFYDESRGLPYFESIFDKTTVLEWESKLKDEIIEELGAFVRTVSIDYSANNDGTLYYSLTLNTIFGEVSNA